MIHLCTLLLNFGVVVVFVVVVVVTCAINVGNVWVLCCFSVQLQMKQILFPPVTSHVETQITVAL